MTTTIPPAHSKIAASLDWETATVEDLWERSDRAGVPIRALLATIQKFGGVQAKD